VTTSIGVVITLKEIKMHVSNQTLFYNTKSNQDASAAIPNSADQDGLGAQRIQDLESHKVSL